MTTADSVDDMQTFGQRENYGIRRKSDAFNFFDSVEDEDFFEDLEGGSIATRESHCYSVMSFEEHDEERVERERAKTNSRRTASGDEIATVASSTTAGSDTSETGALPADTQPTSLGPTIIATTPEGKKIELHRTDKLTPRQQKLLRLFSTDEDHDQAINTVEHRRSSITAKADQEALVKKKFIFMDDLYIYFFYGSRKIRYDSFRRLLRVSLSYPFVLVFGLLNLDQTAFFQDHFKGWFSFCMMVNAMIYILPVIVIRFILYKHSSQVSTTLWTGCYVALYLLPVIFVCLNKIKLLSVSNKIVDGTFHYLPKYTLRFTCPNVCNVYGIVMEFLILALYTMPAEVLGGRKKGGTVQNLTGIPYEYVFWVFVAGAFLNAGAFVMHPVLRGKYKYRYCENHAFWQVIHFINGPLFITVVTFLFQALSCDYTDPDRPVLIEQNTIVCFEDTKHIYMSIAAMMAIALYLLQATLVPTLTYKETMFNKQLDVLYVPVYVQSHWILKAVYASVYVTCYGYNEVYRVCFLLLIIVLMLMLNLYVQPCSIRSINVMRTASFTSATWSAMCSALYMIFLQDENCASFSFLVLIMVCGWLMIFGGSFLFYRRTQRPIEHEVDHTFLELERQAQSGEVHPRVMEPFIAMTMEIDNSLEMLDECKLTIPQLIWLVDYPNVRIQYQALWAIANLGQHQGCRTLIMSSQSRDTDELGIEVLFRIFMSHKSQPALKMEALAAMINCSVARNVSRRMVFEMGVLKSLVELLWRNTMYTQFVTMLISNLAKDEDTCNSLCEMGAVHALMGLVQSPNFQKQKYACMALANITQYMSDDKKIFSDEFIDRVIKMAVHSDIDIQAEISTLVRNLSFHVPFANQLRQRGAMIAITVLKKSIFPNVRECGELAAQNLMNFAIDDDSRLTTKVSNVNASDGDKGYEGRSSPEELLKLEKQKAILRSFDPLPALVGWDTWGSKLDTVFSPVFAAAPQAIGRHVETIVDQPRKIMLKGEDSQGRALTFRIVHAPSHGWLGMISPDKTVIYTPDDGYSGDDYFSYCARNNYMESNLATVAIKIRDENGLEEEAAKVGSHVEKSGMGAGNLAPALNLIGASVTHTFETVGQRGGKAVGGLVEGGLGFLNTVGTGIGTGLASLMNLQGGKKRKAGGSFDTFDIEGEDIDGDDERRRSKAASQGGGGGKVTFATRVDDVSLETVAEGTSVGHDDADGGKGKGGSKEKSADEDDNNFVPATAQARIEMRNLLRQKSNLTEKQISKRTLGIKNSSSSTKVSEHSNE